MSKAPSLIRLLAALFLGFTLSVPSWSYTSQKGRFSCPNPLENSPGARVEELPDGVSFSNDFGERYRVETMSIDQKGKALMNQNGREAYLDVLLKGFYVPDLVLKAVPDAAIVKDIYLKDLRGGAAMLHLFLPKAGLEKTTINLMTNKSTTHRMDTVRSLLVFLEKDRIVYVSSEISPKRPDEYAPTAAEDARRAERLTSQTLRFTRQIVLTE